MRRQIGAVASAGVRSAFPAALFSLLGISCGQTTASGAIAELRSQCESGRAEQCTRLGGIFDRGDGVQKDRNEAAALYRLGCDKGDTWGCVNLGLSTEAGLGVASDPQAAAELYLKACDGGNADGCFKLAALHDSSGPVAQQNPARAMTFYARACDAAMVAGCTRLADLYRQGGPELLEDHGRAVQLYQQACKGDDAVACLSLARIYQQQNGRDPGDGEDPEQLIGKGMRMLDAQCELGRAGECLLLGVVFDEGIVVPTDSLRARQYYRRSCDLGNSGACAWASGSPKG